MTKDVMETAIKSLLTKLEATENFVLDQAPSVCKEILLEHKIDAGFSLITSLVFTLILTSFDAYLIYEYFKPTEHSVDGFGYAICAFLVSGALLGAVAWVATSLNLLATVMFCPKLVLLREFRSLLSKRKSN